jgi:hypothetical protein
MAPPPVICTFCGAQIMLRTEVTEVDIDDGTSEVSHYVYHCEECGADRIEVPAD